MMTVLKIEPVYGFDRSTSVTTYKVVDNSGSIWFTGGYRDCVKYIENNFSSINQQKLQ